MVVPRRLVPLPLLAVPLLAFTPALTGATAAPRKKPSVKGYVVPCLTADGQKVEYSARPKSCIAADEFAQERQLVPIKQLKWTTWTTKRAKATGTLKGTGYSGKAVVTATKPKRCSARRVIFTSVTIAIPTAEGLGPVAQLTVACPR